MNLTNHFLVAMPGMQDPYFQRSVVYLCEHNEEGAMGIIVNAPLNVTIGTMLEQMSIPPLYPQSRLASLAKPVLSGGPVAEDRGFILHKSTDYYESTVKMSEHISITTSRDILGVLGTTAEPERYLVILGYAGWEAGQLEQELAENAWLTVDADPALIFDTPVNERWIKAIEKLGINIAQLSQQSGHA